MSTSVASVTSHFPSAENGFTTTTSGSVTSGASSVGINSTAGYTNNEVVVFVIDPTDATKKQTFTGIMDTGGNQVTNVVWTAGTNQGHDAGATVVDYATATHISMITKGILVEHNQDGTHDETIIVSRTEDTTPASGDYLLTSDVSASNALKKVSISNLFANMPSSTELPAGSVDPEDLVSGTGTTWAWQSWTPTFANFTKGSATITSKYIQIGKTVFYRLSVILASDSSMGTSPTFTLPVTAVTVAEANVQPVGTLVVGDAGAATYLGIAEFSSTTVARMIIADDAAAGVRLDTGITSTSPMTWTTTDSFHSFGFYEAA